MTKIDIKRLIEEIANLKPDQVLYKVLRDELTKIERWKAKKRGNPKQAYQMGLAKLKEQQNDNNQPVYDDSKHYDEL